MGKRKGQILSSVLAVALVAHAASMPAAFAQSPTPDRARMALRRQVTSLIDDEKYKEANALLQAELQKEKIDQVEKLRIYLDLADLAINQEDAQTANNFLNRSLSLAKKLGNPELQLRYVDLRSDYYNALLKDYKKGISYRLLALSKLTLFLDGLDPRVALYQQKLAAEYRKAKMPKEAAAEEARAQMRLEQFLGAVQKQIKTNWRPSRQAANRVAKASFDIDDEGRFSNRKIIHSSGNEEFDQVCLKALENSKLENFYYFESALTPIRFEFTFTRNVSGHSKKPSKTPRLDLIIKQVQFASDLEVLTKQFTVLTKDPNLNEDKTLLMQYEIFKTLISFHLFENANRFISSLQLNPALSARGVVLLGGERAILLEIKKKYADAELLLKDAVASPEFDKLPEAQMRRTFLSAYGDLLYERDQKDEAKQIYERMPPLY